MASVTSDQFDKICMFRNLLKNSEDYPLLKTLAQEFCKKNLYNLHVKYLFDEMTGVMKSVFCFTEGKKMSSVLSVTVAYGFESYHQLVENKTSLYWKLLATLGSEALQAELEPVKKGASKK